MPITLSCPGCKTALRVRDDLAGKKVKCPRCARVVLVPVREDDATEVLGAPEGIVGARGGAKGKKPPRRRDDTHEDDYEEHERHRVTAQKPVPRRRRDEEDEGQEEPKGKRSKYKPCPRCGATGAHKVKWTFWGSFYGPAMFTHVRCPECGYAYNGKTGGSNLIPAIIFITVPLLGILAIFGVIAFFLHRQGYF
jgi:predicted Zn finger-like uncharacterized protein